MGVLLSRRTKNKPNWMRMNRAFNLLWAKYQPDADLKAGKGWLVQSLDAIHICEVLDENNVEYEKISEYEVQIF